jgi:hypothetical protein
MEPPRKAFKCLRGEAGLDVVADAKEKLCGLSGDEGEVHEGPAAQVEEHYYVRNFVLVMDEVLARYESLLWPKEREMIATWKSLSYPAQQLFVRLYLRKVSEVSRLFAILSLIGLELAVNMVYS